MEEVKISKSENISPKGLLYDLYVLGSDYTDVQRTNMINELNGRVVQWKLPLYEVSREGQNKYRIQTSSGNLFGANYVSTFATLYTQNQNEAKYVESLKTGDMITIKGTINGIAGIRSINIEPAILILNRRNK